MTRTTLVILCLGALCIAPPLLNAFGLIHAPWLLVFAPIFSVSIIFIVLSAVGMYLVGREYRSSDKDND